MRHVMAGLASLVLTGCAVVEDAALPPAEPAPLGFVWIRTGDGLFIYHQVSASCDTIEHRHGRNAAWGLWRLPLAGVVEHGLEETGDDQPILRFTCTDGSACIQAGALSETPDRIDTHAIPFGTPELARKFAGEVAALKTACGAAS